MHALINNGVCIAISEEKICNAATNSNQFQIEVDKPQLGCLWDEGKGILADKPQEQIDYEFALTENEWVKSSLANADVQINYHLDGDGLRATASLEKWRSYRIELRDYVKNGKVTKNSRPSHP